MFMKYTQIKTSGALVNFSTAFSKKSYSFVGSFKNDKRKLYGDYITLSNDLTIGVNKINRYGKQN